MKKQRIVCRLFYDIGHTSPCDQCDSFSVSIGKLRSGWYRLYCYVNGSLDTHDATSLDIIHYFVDFKHTSLLGVRQLFEESMK